MYKYFTKSFWSGLNDAPDDEIDNFLNKSFVSEPEVVGYVAANDRLVITVKVLINEKVDLIKFTKRGEK